MELENRFKYHKPDAKKVKLHTFIRTMAFTYAVTLEESCPDCRERSIAITKIEEAMMWANAAIARNDLASE